MGWYGELKDATVKNALESSCYVSLESSCDVSLYIKVAGSMFVTLPKRN